MWAMYEKNKQAIHDIALLLAAILLCFLFFRYLSPIFLPFIIGWLMSLLFNPLCQSGRSKNAGFLETLRYLPRKTACGTAGILSGISE